MAKSYPDVGTFTSGQILTAAKMNEVGDNLDNFRVPSLCVLRRTALFTMAAANTDYSITFTTGNEDADTDAMHDGTTNTDRITIGTAGIYAITASCQFGAPNFVGSFRYLWLDMRGSINGQLVADYQIPASGEGVLACISTIVKCSASDYFRMFVKHNDNVSRDVVVTTQPILFSAAWLGTTS